MAKKHWWQQGEPLLIGGVQVALGDRDWIIDNYISKYGFNVEFGVHALSGGGFIVNYDDDRDREGIIKHAKKAHEYGIREVIYTNTHVLSLENSRQHPEWCQINKEGKPKIYYGIYSATCVNPDGAFHKNYLEELKKLCQLDIDGIYSDGPVMRREGCYCEACQARFEKRFGHSIFEATRLELQTMSVETVTQHIKEVYETIKSINPEIAYFINNSALRADITGSNTRKIYNYVDILEAEGGFHAAELGRGIWSMSACSKHLECFAGDPRYSDKAIICDLSANMSGISEYPHTATEIAFGYSQIFANGANIWFGPHFKAEEFAKTENALMAKEMNGFITQNKDVFAPSKTCARVALMWSQDTANNYASSVADSDFVAAKKSGFTDRGDHYVSLITAFDMLVRNHIQFDIIDETSILNGTIDNYDSVIFPSVACMSDQVAEKVLNFVRSGGSVLGNFDIGLYNEDGSYADKPKLAELFGLCGTPEIKKGINVSSTYYFKQKDDSIINNLSLYKIPGAILNVKWDVADNAEVIMNANQPKKSVYEAIPLENMYPAVVKNCYGKGTAYYISGAFCEFVAEERNIPDYSKMVADFCNLTSKPVVETDSAGLYEVVLRRQENRFILHVVNITGAMARPLEKIVPLYNVPFKLDLNGFGIDKKDYSLKSIRGANPENITFEAGKISFTLDKLDAYEVIVIE